MLPQHYPQRQNNSPTFRHQDFNQAGKQQSQYQILLNHQNKQVQSLGRSPESRPQHSLTRQIQQSQYSQMNQEVNQQQQLYYKQGYSQLENQRTFNKSNEPFQQKKGQVTNQKDYNGHNGHYVQPLQTQNNQPPLQTSQSIYKLLQQSQPTLQPKTQTITQVPVVSNNKSVTSLRQKSLKERQTQKVNVINNNKSIILDINTIQLSTQNKENDDVYKQYFFSKQEVISPIKNQQDSNYLAGSINPNINKRQSHDKLGSELKSVTGVSLSSSSCITEESKILPDFVKSQSKSNKVTQMVGLLNNQLVKNKLIVAGEFASQKKELLDISKAPSMANKHRFSFSGLNGDNEIDDEDKKDNSLQLLQHNINDFIRGLKKRDDPTNIVKKLIFSQSDQVKEFSIIKHKLTDPNNLSEDTSFNIESQRIEGKNRQLQVGATQSSNKLNSSIQDLYGVSNITQTQIKPSLQIRQHNRHFSMDDSEQKIKEQPIICDDYQINPKNIDKEIYVVKVPILIKETSQQHSLLQESQEKYSRERKLKKSHEINQLKKQEKYAQEQQSQIKVSIIDEKQALLCLTSEIDTLDLKSKLQKTIELQLGVNLYQDRNETNEEQIVDFHEEQQKNKPQLGEEIFQSLNTLPTDQEDQIDKSIIEDDANQRQITQEDLPTNEDERPIMQNSDNKLKNVDPKLLIMTEHQSPQKILFLKHEKIKSLMDQIQFATSSTYENQQIDVQLSCEPQEFLIQNIDFDMSMIKAEEQSKSQLQGLQQFTINQDILLSDQKVSVSEQNSKVKNLGFFQYQVSCFQPKSKSQCQEFNKCLISHEEILNIIGQSIVKAQNELSPSTIKRSKSKSKSKLKYGQRNKPILHSKRTEYSDNSYYSSFQSTPKVSVHTHSIVSQNQNAKVKLNSKNYVAQNKDQQKSKKVDAYAEFKRALNKNLALEQSPSVTEYNNSTNSLSLKQDSSLSLKQDSILSERGGNKSQIYQKTLEQVQSKLLDMQKCFIKK